jgi:hypothetical protein
MKLHNQYFSSHIIIIITITTTIIIIILSMCVRKAGHVARKGANATDISIKP